MAISVRQVRVSPTVTCEAAAYATGDLVGGKLTLTALGNSGLITGARITSKSLQTCFFDIVVFNDNPSGSTFTENGAFDVADADLSKVVGVLHLNDVTALSGASVHQTSGNPLSFVLPGATTGYAAIVIRGAPTFASTSDLSFSIRVQQDY
jgi:uncharacterized phosphosugar-binding protein